MLVGPSGCGKSTSLRMLAGLEDVNAGRILIGDRDVTQLPPKDRDIAMVFQSYALYPHMTVADNMGFALKIAGINKDEIRSRVDEAAKILDLEQYLERKPKALSGGQRQRVAMGRAIVRKPQVFLMDEPLSNLDAKLRVQTRTQIASLQRRLGVTTVYVTHDQVEAMTMGDRVCVLKDGLLHAGRHPARALRPPEQRLRGRLHRLPGDEPARAARRATAASSSVTPSTPWSAAVLSGTGEPRHGRRPARGPRGSPTAASPVQVDVVEELGADAYIYGRASTSAGRGRGGPGSGHHPRRRPADHRPHRRPPAAGEGQHGALRTRAGPRAPVRRRRAASASA